MHQLFEIKVHPKTTGPQNILDESMDVKAQIRVLEKNKKKAHLQAKLKQFQIKKALRFSI